MKARKATFITSATRPSQFPPAELPEIAIAGRSNVGKSSLINTLVGTVGLAKTSNTPGRTRLLNWFRVQPQKGPPFAVVDLPGYGYAKVPKALREGWRPMVESYLEGRDVLRGVLCLIDARRGAQQEEHELFEWLEEAGIQAVAVLTKADKIPKSKRKLAALEVKRDLGLRAAPVVCSSHSKEGLVELWRVVTRMV